MDMGIQGPGLMAVSAPFSTVMWDYINRGMPLGKEGSLKPDEVYALTALTIKGVLNYQACDDNLCFNPQSVPLTWKVNLRQLDRDRANP